MEGLPASGLNDGSQSDIGVGLGLGDPSVCMAGDSVLVVYETQTGTD